MPSCSSFGLTVLITGPLKSINYFLASFSKIFLIEWWECIPLNLVLSFNTSAANLDAILSSAVYFTLLLTDGSQSLLSACSLTDFSTCSLKLIFDMPVLLLSIQINLWITYCMIHDSFNHHLLLIFLEHRYFLNHLLQEHQAHLLPHSILLQFFISNHHLF